MAGTVPLSAAVREALRTGHRTRLVRHARLLPALSDDAPQMRFALEDALNTADFGDCGRLILVRRLCLRSLPRQAGPALLAQALEQAWRELAPRAVAHDDPHARNAEVVYFASRLEARLAWLQAHCTGRGTDAWFWRAAVPELAQSASSGAGAHGIRVLVQALLQESANQLVRMLREWPEQPLLALAAELDDAIAEHLLDACTTGLAPVRAWPADVRGPPQVAANPAPEPAWPSVLARLRRHVPRRKLPLWLAAVWMSAARGEPPSRAQVVALVALAATHPPDSETMPLSGPGPVTPVATRGGRAWSAQAGAAVPGASRTRFASAPASTGSPQADADAEPGPDETRASLALPSDLPSARRRDTAPGPRRNAGTWPWLDNATPTTHGGLLLTVNLLQDLRFEHWIETLPDPERQAFANALPLHVLRQTRCAPDEPQLAWFDDAAQPMARPLRAWTLRMRRFLRRHAGMDLDGLVRRPAWVSATTTHADVIFALEQTDLRLRRLGLDRDPGWVPWLGRIVNFHFLAQELLPVQREAPERHG